MSTKAIAYVRVSTLEQVEGLSLAAQQAKVRAYCKLHGLELVDVLRDEGLSAKTIRNRPGALEVLRRIEKREVGAVVIYKLDRLFRNTVDAIQTSELCKRRSVALHSITERLDTSIPAGEFFFTVISALGQLERKQIGERTAASLQFKRQRGEKTGGFCPYGWDYKTIRRDGNLVRVLRPNKFEQKVLITIRRMRNRKASLMAIARRLKRRGILTKCGKSEWSPMSIYRILARETISVRPK